MTASADDLAIPRMAKLGVVASTDPFWIPMPPELEPIQSYGPGQGAHGGHASDITACDPAKIVDTSVLRTMVGGEWVYTRA